MTHLKCTSHTDYFYGESGVFRFFFQHWKVFFRNVFHRENISIWEWQNLHFAIPFHTLSCYSSVVALNHAAICSIQQEQELVSHYQITASRFQRDGVCNHTHIKRQIEADPLIQRCQYHVMPTQNGQHCLKRWPQPQTTDRPPSIHTTVWFMHVIRQNPSLVPSHELDKQLQNPHWHWSDGNTSILHQNDLLQTNSDVTISKSHDTIISRYEVHDTIFVAIFTKNTNWELEKNECFVHFKLKLFYLTHFESSKWRAPTHVLN